MGQVDSFTATFPHPACQVTPHLIVVLEGCPHSHAQRGPVTVKCSVTPPAIPHGQKSRAQGPNFPVALSFNLRDSPLVTSVGQDDGVCPFGVDNCIDFPGSPRVSGPLYLRVSPQTGMADLQLAPSVPYRCCKT